MRRRSSIKWILLGAFTLSAIAGPFVINESYKTGTGYVTLWGAAEMLSYFGMLLAAAGTVIGVFLSIQHAQKQYQEDKRQRVLPFFAINRLKQEKVDTFVQGLYYGLMQKNPPSKQTPLEEIKGLRYKEYPVNEGFFFIKGEKIEFSTEIDEELKQKAEKETNPVLDGMLPHFDDLNPIYIPIRLKNVGNGCAICMQISVEKGEAVASSPSVSIIVVKIKTFILIQSDATLFEKALQRAHFHPHFSTEFYSTTLYFNIIAQRCRKTKYNLYQAYFLSDCTVLYRRDRC